MTVLVACENRGDKYNMAVIRVNKTKNYTVMSNYHLRDKRLSLKAKGLLSVMLSLPESWDYSIAGLVAICKENTSAVKTALDELKEYGYLCVIKEYPTENNGGRITYIYDVFEQPHENQQKEKQDIENLCHETQHIEKKLQYNNNKLNTDRLNIDKKIKNNTNTVNEMDAISQANSGHLCFEDIWEIYPRKAGKKKAFAAYNKALDNGVDAGIILQGVKAYNDYIKREKIPQKYIKMGSTWFNGECWDDDYGQSQHDDTLDAIF